MRCLLNYLKLLLLCLAAISLAVYVTPVAKTLAQTPVLVDYSKYVWTEYASKDPTTVSASLKQNLDSEVNKMLIDTNGDGIADHLAPLAIIYGTNSSYSFPQDQYDATKGGKSGSKPHFFFLDPGEEIYSLSLAYPYLSAATQTKVKAFLTQEMSKYTPLALDIFGTSSSYYQGTSRQAYVPPSDVGTNIWPPVGTPIETLYGYWLYAKNVDPTVVASNWTAMSNLYTTYKNAYTAGRKPTYSEIGGIIAFARMAKMQGQTTLSTDAANLAIQIMSNEGLNFSQMQTNINSAVLGSNLDWTDVVFANIQPEVGKYLKDNVSTPISSYLNTITSMKQIPNWYQAWSEHQGYANKSAGASPTNTTGFIAEEPYYLPIISYSIFLGKAYVQNLDQSSLTSYLDVPWSIGDLYYLQKLVTTIEAPAPASTLPATTPAPTLAPTLAPTPAPTPAPTVGALDISNVTNNALSYPNSQIPKYEKFELTFNIANTVATNLQIPYDANPPAGIKPKIGISVDAVITQPDGSTVTQPAFLYQDYQKQQINGKEWLYPNSSPVWKVRFAPRQVGTYQYKLQATDSSGTVFFPQTGTLSFSATNPQPGNHGFLKVAANDKRYFEFSDGTPFVGNGLSTSFSTTADADTQFARYSQNGINFVRTWLTGSTISGSAWDPWWQFGGPGYGGYIPSSGLTPAPAGSGYDFTFDLKYNPTANVNTACIMNGFQQGPIAVKPNTTYKISLKTMLEGVSGPRNAANPNYGLAVKVASWAGGNFDCINSLGGAANIIPYSNSTNLSGWQTVSGNYTTGAGDNFLNGNLWVFLENTNDNAGVAHIAQISMQEVLGGGNLGPDILTKSKSDAHLDFNLQKSWDWDYIFDNAAKNNVYLKTVVLEKNDIVWNNIKPDGTVTATPDNNNFYAAPNTKVGALQQYYYRYLTARWGYSRSIHSWEYVNEGDPFNGNHYQAADNFAKYIHQNDPSPHMVTTSFWHSFPAAEFWGNPAYPNVDYADLHAYISTGNFGQYEWPIPPGTTWDTTTSLGTTGGSLKVAAGNTAHIDLPAIKGQGNWSFSFMMKTENLTGSCPYGDPATKAGPVLLVQVSGGGATREIPYDPAAPDKYFICTNTFTGTNNWTSFSGSIPITDNNYHSFNLTFSTQYAAAGTAWFDNLVIISPTGQRFEPFGDGTFDTRSRLDYDTSLYTDIYSQFYGVNGLSGVGKPLVRGETGVDYPTQQSELANLSLDTTGVWLHNLVWGQINAGGMSDLYWWTDSSSAIGKNNLWSVYKPFSTFMSNIPLNSGKYKDAQAQTTSPNVLRVWGQKDISNDHAYLWIQNRNHTWNNVIAGTPITAVPGDIYLTLTPNATFNVTWFDTYTSATTNSTITSDAKGKVALSLPSALSTDIAVKLDNASTTNCSVTSSSWGIPSATVGQAVPLSVTTSGNCTGKQVNITVLKNGVLGGGVNVSPGQIAIDSTGRTNASWIAESHPDPLNLLNPSQYYFNTNVVGDTTIVTSSSPLLSVTEAVTTNPTPTPTPTPTPLPGDLDGNGKVDIFDYNILVADYGKTGTGLVSDIDKSGKVDIFDYNILVTNFGKKV